METIPEATIEKIKNINDYIDSLVQKIPALSIVGITGYTDRQIEELRTEIILFETENSIQQLGLSRAISTFLKVHNNYNRNKDAAAKLLRQMGEEFKIYLNGTKAMLACLLELQEGFSIFSPIPPYLGG